MAALDEMDDTANDLSERVHRIESELQGDALYAAVEFIHGDGWVLGVLAADGSTVYEWGAIADDCMRPCIDPEAVPAFSDDCRAVAVGSTGHILCGSRER